jgi:hypothetical protein
LDTGHPNNCFVQNLVPRYQRIHALCYFFFLGRIFYTKTKFFIIYRFRVHQLFHVVSYEKKNHKDLNPVNEEVMVLVRFLQSIYLENFRLIIPSQLLHKDLLDYFLKRSK